MRRRPTLPALLLVIGWACAHSEPPERPTAPVEALGSPTAAPSVHPTATRSPPELNAAALANVTASGSGAAQLARQTDSPNAQEAADIETRYLEGYVDDTRCPSVTTDEQRTLVEAGGAKQFFSVHGYLAQNLRLTNRSLQSQHCLSVLWPPGPRNSADQPVGVAQSIDGAWFRLIENTLARLPWDHVRLVQRIVIDNRPKKHGIAAFDRQLPEDARDGRTLWLHEHLFRAPNHWEAGNYGSYWGYHVNLDTRVVDGAPVDHDLFSPILLHEMGHLVMYWIENAHLQGPEATSNLPCASTCKDLGNCRELSKAEREQGCISPYCAPFRFESSTENWAEQYRFFYQSSLTRGLLERANAGCRDFLRRQAGAFAPWQRGLPDMTSYRRSLWDSCGRLSCKDW